MDVNLRVSVISSIFEMKASLHFALAIREASSSVEHLVTEGIQKRFHFAAFRVDEKEKRLDLESRIISTISQCEDCVQSKQWLGLHSPKAKIRESGLWR